MSGTHFLTHGDHSVLLKRELTQEGRMARVAYLREHATMMLAKATERIPVVSDSILAAYRAAGKEPVWNLENDDLAKQLCAQLKDYNPTANEIHAAELLRACICAQELGDVPEIKHMKMGENYSLQQKSKARQSRSSFSLAKEGRIAKRYEQVKGEYGAIKALAAEFNVTPKAIREIAKRRNTD